MGSSWFDLRFRRTHLLSLALVLLFLPIGIAWAASTIVDDFDSYDPSGFQVWFATGATVTHSSGGGNPEGFLSIQDTDSDTFEVHPPPKYSGDLRAYDKGVLTYDVKVLVPTSQLTSVGSGFGRIQFNGLGSNATFDYGSNPPIPSSSSWTTYTVPMTASAWHTTQANWDAVLSNVNNIRIILEPENNSTVTLDNFKISPITAAPTFVESSGQVVIEAEHYTVRTSPNAQNWQPGSTKTGFVGTGYMEALPNSGTSYSSGYVTNSPELIYNVNFSTAGTYYVWIRGQGDSGNDDSLHAGVDGTGPASADGLNGFNTTSWVWKRQTLDGVAPTLVIATPGPHTIHLWVREDGFRVDRFLLRKSSSSTAPSGVGPPESPQSNPDSTPPVITDVDAGAFHAVKGAISWVTDEPSTSDAGCSLYHGGEGRGENDPTLVTQHRVVITSLRPGTSYECSVESTDAAGNIGIPSGENSNQFLFSTADAPTQGLAFQEAGGQVVLEAEHYDYNLSRNGIAWGNGMLAPAGYSGGGYAGTSSSGVAINAGFAQTSPELVYRILFVTPGTYYVWLRGAAASTNDDLVHSGLDGIPVSSADRISGFSSGWTWRRDTTEGSPATLVIPAAGVYTFHLWMGEDGLIVDKIILRTNSSSTAPSGIGMAESPWVENPSDRISPQILNWDLVFLGGSGPTVTWNTNEPATTQIFFGPFREEGILRHTSPLDIRLQSAHQVLVEAQDPETVDGGILDIVGLDKSGNVAIATNIPFDGYPLNVISPFQEVNGMVVMEAEHYDTKRPAEPDDPPLWQLEVGQSEFSGPGYMTALPNVGTNVTTGYVSSAPELTYKANFSTVGTYYVLIRASATNGSDDSLHSGIDGSGSTTADKVNGFVLDWSWRRTTADGPSATLDITTPGIHTIHLWMQEDGLRVDKIMLREVNIQDTVSGLGPPESVRSDTPPPPQVAQPSINPNGGSFDNSVEVTLATTTPSAAIHYTIDGSAPTSASTLYTQPFMLLSSATVQAIGFRAGYANSSIANASFTITPSSPPDSFQESAGQVVMEAEHFDVKTPRGGKDWTLGTTPGGFSGTGHLTASPNTGVSLPSGFVTTSPELAFNVNFATTGTYYVWVRGQASVANGADDSLHAGLDGAGPDTADNMDGFNTTSWVWKRQTLNAGPPATLVIATPGLHTIHLWMREDGLKVDKILLRKSSSSTAPSGAGPAESPRAAP